MIEWLYFLFIASLPIVRPFNFRLFGLLVPASDVIFAATALTWVVGVVRGRASVHSSRFYLVLGGYFAALCLSTIASEQPESSAAKLVGEAYLIAVAVLTFNVVRTWGTFRSVMNAWMVGTAVTVAAGVLGVLLFYAGLRDPSVNFAMSGYGSLPSGPYPRIRALFANQNMMCNYLNLSLMFILMMNALGWLTPVRSRVLLAGTWITGIFALSPGLGGFFLAASAWLWVREPRGRRSTVTRVIFGGGIAAAVALVVALVLVPATSGRPGDFMLPVVNAPIARAPRVFIWQSAFQTFVQHPILGRGVGMEVALFEYVTPTGRFEHLTDAHNLWLSIAGQDGIVGIAAFLALVVYLCRRIFPLRADPDRSTIVKTGLGLAFVSALLYQGLGGAFENARHLWVLMGLIVCADEWLTPERQPS